MSEVFKFSEAANLAFHAMLELATAPTHEMPLKEIAGRLQVSEAHLSKVLQRLRKTSLVEATRGPSGGYRLARTPGKISFAEVYEAIEGPFHIRQCLFPKPICGACTCVLGRFVGDLNQQMLDFLQKNTLASFLKANPMTGVHPAISPA